MKIEAAYKLIGAVLVLATIVMAALIAVFVPLPADASTWWTAAGAIITAVATVALVIATALVWEVTRQSALAATRAAHSAEQALILAKDTAQKQLRAYVTVEGAGIESVAAGLQPLAVVGFKNSGQTPAKNVRVRSAIGLRPIPLQQSSLVFPTVINSRLTLGPGISSRSHAQAPAPLSAQTLSAIQSGQQVIVLFGQIDYEDEFGVERWTRFCLRHGQAQQPGTMNFTEEGNEST